MESVIQSVVVGEGNVEGIEPRGESAGEVSYPPIGIRVIESAVIFLPIDIPRRLVIWGGIVGSRFFSDPKNGGRDRLLPGVNGRFLKFEWVLGGRHDRDFGSVLRGGQKGGGQEEKDYSKGQGDGAYLKNLRFPAMTAWRSVLAGRAVARETKGRTKCAAFTLPNFTSNCRTDTPFQWISSGFPRIC